MDHSGHDNGTMMHMMQMFFTTSCETTILFEKWQTKTCLQMFGSCVVIFMASILYEGLKALRNHLQWWMTCRSCKKQTSQSSTPTTDNQQDNVQFIQPSFGPVKMSKKQTLLLLHLIQSLLYLVQVGYGYLVMLVAMTFNVWLFISIFIGAGCGYFIFNFKKVWGIIQGGDACPADDEGETHCHL